MAAGRPRGTGWWGSGHGTQTRVLDHLPAGRLICKPLYVLIDQGAALAAKSFAYDAQQFKLGRLVGVGSAGAANPTGRGQTCLRM